MRTTSRRKVKDVVNTTYLGMSLHVKPVDTTLVWKSCHTFAVLACNLFSAYVQAAVHQ